MWVAYAPRSEEAKGSSHQSRLHLRACGVMPVLRDRISYACLASNNRSTGSIIQYSIGDSSAASSSHDGSRVCWRFHFCVVHVRLPVWRSSLPCRENHEAIYYGAAAQLSIHFVCSSMQGCRKTNCGTGEKRRVPSLQESSGITHSPTPSTLPLSLSAFPTWRGMGPAGPRAPCAFRIRPPSLCVAL